MPVINSLSTSSIKKLKRVSDKVTTTPQSTGINNRRRLGGTQGGGDDVTSIYPCIVTSVTTTAVYGVRVSNPTGTPFLIAPLSYQDTNFSIGTTIMASEYTAITL